MRVHSRGEQNGVPSRSSTAPRLLFLQSGRERKVNRTLLLSEQGIDLLLSERRRRGYNRGPGVGSCREESLPVRRGPCRPLRGVT